MVNTSYDEVYPIIAADGKTLYFVRKEYPGNVGGPNADIWYSEMLPDSTWSIARNIGEPLNTPGYNYVCYAMPDNNTVLLGNHYNPDGTQTIGISMSRRAVEGWARPLNVQVEKIINFSPFCEHTMSPDGRVLICSIKAPDSLGGRDLYISFRVNDTAFTKPHNLGPELNSIYEDITPFLAADGRTLYFSSARPGGFGSNDIYVTRRLDDTWLSWTPPENMGYPINTSGWDAYYSVPASGNYAYFVSTLDGYGMSDIFRIKLPERVKPLPVLLVTGITKDFQDRPIAAKIHFHSIHDSTEKGTAYANPMTGAYTLSLPAGSEWVFHAEYPDHYPVSEYFDLRTMKEYAETRKDLMLVPIERGSTVRLNNIFFDFDMATLRPESRDELDRLVRFLESRPEMSIEIAGHTDSLGTEEYNITLSAARAEAVVTYLIEKGIPAERLGARGYGETRPVDTNGNDEGRQRNRRVEFTIL